MIDDTVTRQSDIAILTVFDSWGNILFSNDHAKTGLTVAPSWLTQQRNVDQTSMKLAFEGAQVFGTPLLNGFNAQVGTLALGYSDNVVQANLRNTKISMLQNFAVIIGASVVLIILSVIFASRGLLQKTKPVTFPQAEPSQRFSMRAKMLLIAFSALLLANGAGAYQALSIFKAQLSPEIYAHSLAIGVTTTTIIDKALQAGIPFTDLVGVPESLDLMREANPSVLYAAIVDTNGTLLYQSGTITRALGRHFRDSVSMGDTNGPAAGYLNSSFTISLQGKPLGMLYLGQDESLIRKIINEISYDILTVIVVSMLIAFELLYFIVGYVMAPHSDPHGPGAHIREDKTTAKDEDHMKSILQGKIRPALFLLVFSESMSLSFFPMFVEQFYVPISGISKEILIGLPISAFMLVWAISLPFSGEWSDKVGRRKPFIIGALITAAGLVMTGLSHSYYELLVWRSFTAAGYGIIFITCQGYIIDHSTMKTRAKGMSMFLAGFFAGSLSGAAIGAILSQRIGYESTFILSAALSLGAAAFVYAFIQESANRAQKSHIPNLSIADYKTIFSNPKFLALTFCVAIPAKVCLTGFLYYTGPIFLKTIGTDQSSIGRVLMAYGLAIIIVSPLSARFADKFGNRKLFVIGGSLLAGLAVLILGYFDTLIAVVFSVTLLGIAHAISVSSQLSLVIEIFDDEKSTVGMGKVVGIFRFIERLGSVIGPILAGVLIGIGGFNDAFIGIGMMTLIGIAIFALVFANKAPPKSEVSTVDGMGGR
ncbi:MAG: MFS transporter [Magnetovibrio sp.]|nr:MFS transporter [Magnetovibrio sp.]